MIRKIMKMLAIAAALTMGLVGIALSVLVSQQAPAGATMN